MSFRSENKQKPITEQHNHLPRKNQQVDAVGTNRKWTNHRVISLHPPFVLLSCQLVLSRLSSRGPLLLPSRRPPVFSPRKLVVALPLVILSLHRPLIISLCRMVAALTLVVPPSCPLIVPHSWPSNTPTTAAIACRLHRPPPPPPPPPAALSNASPSCIDKESSSSLLPPPPPPIPLPLSLSLSLS